ncbi:LTA synthase family protein [Evansella sp. AB-rgal1]|uniref:LTA synthase family protein n=1 Tax=Evansella sp. AB-rgal1 TaxID=3242696 RepID=UPI00359D0967
MSWNHFSKWMTSHFFIFLLIILVKVHFTRMFLFNDNIFGFSLFIELLFPLLIALFIEFCFRKGKNIAYYIVNFVFSVLFFSIIMYFDFYGAVPTYSALLQADQVGEVGDSIAAIFRPIYLLLFVDIILLPFFLKKKWISSNFPIKRRLSMLIALPIVILLSLGVIYTNSTIINTINQAEKMGIFHFQLYSVYHDQKTQSRLHSIINNDLDQSIINELKGIETREEFDYYGIAKDKNILVVQLESLQTFPISLEIEGNEVTPILNNLIEDSYYFPNVFQQIGRGNTSDAEFALNTSIYPLGDRAMSQEFGNRDIPSLPKILREHNYESVTFHTNDVQFWYRDGMYQALGFDSYYDKAFFGTDDFIAFGASDEVLYEKSLPILEDIWKTGKKFYANLVAMSSHHPYTLPDTKELLPLPSHYENTAVGDYLRAVHYADFALGELIKDLKDKGLWDDTLLFIYGDHFGLRLETDLDYILMEEILDRPYHEHVDHFNIPLVVHIPGEEDNAEMFTHIGGQVDYMPTIVNLIGVENDNVMFGQDLFNYDKNLIGMRFYLPSGSFINEDILYTPGNGFHDGKGVDLYTLEEVEVAEYEQDFRRLMDLLELSDAYVTQLPPRRGLESVSSEFPLDGSLEWEHVSNGENYKVVRVNLFSPSITQYRVEREDHTVENVNANIFYDSNQYDLYENGYLYVTIDNSESGWSEDDLSQQDISSFFEQQDFTLFLFEEDFNKINYKLTSFYEIIEETGDKIDLNEELEWEHFSSREDFTIVRVDLEAPETNYFVERDGEILQDRNANQFDQGNLTNLYSNGYLYISIDNNDSKWGYDAQPTPEEIKAYFKEQNYTLYIDTYNELLR